VDGGAPVRLGGTRQRALLALLLTRPNEVVSTDRLIDELWGAQPPPTAANTVQYYVSQLRKLLGADRIETKAPGYALRVEAGELDLGRFEQLVRRGGADEIHEALGLWRGRPLADLEYEPFLQAEIARLEELRLAAFEKRIDRDLEVGRAAELIGELEALVAEHPLRERFCAQLMLALYRAGRQAEALAAYRGARETLVEELGIEPGAALQELERAILRQDPSLDVAAESSAAAQKRSILAAAFDATAVEPLVTLGEALARRPARELIVVRLLAMDEDPAGPTAALAKHREELAARGVEARVAAYRSDSAGKDAVLLATEQDADLVLVDAPGDLLENGVLGDDVTAVLDSAPCDVGLLVKASELRTGGGRPVVVPFGGVEHDWSAVEIAAWLARSLEVPLRLVGTEDSGERRDASRLLARASLVIQTAVGILAEPALVPPGPASMAGALAGASALVMGLSERWRGEGVGSARLEVAAAATVPTLLVRRGLRPGGLAPPETMTRFTWTLAAG
jgi:DNA-binding SARP family transcriptional activator